MQDPTFKLEAVVKSREDMQDFEGPLSLILMLLSKNKIEIRDISVSRILEQYLAYLDEMQAMDLDVASEFVQMASHLLFIKTRMLLAAQEEVSELEELMTSLEILKARDKFTQLKEILPQLDEAARVGALYYEKLPEPVRLNRRDYEYRHEATDLLRSLLDVYSRGGKTAAPPDLSAAPAPIPYGVREKSREIIETLRPRGKVSLKGLYEKCRSRSELVATFISILELCSAGSLRIDKADEDYSLTFTGGDTEEILEGISE